MDAIGKLTGGIAHDFNNLLAAVLGGIGLIERRLPLEDEHKKIVGMTRRAAEQGSELVRRLLAFARRQQLQPAEVDIGRLSTSVTELLAPTLGGLVRLEWGIDKGVWRAFADATQLELALMNLIINARDALPEGGTIRVRAENRTIGTATALDLPEGDYVMLAVEDEGSGISAEILEKVTEPFFTTKEVGKGTGLGLSMVYGFARQSGGAIEIDSEEGEGTRVAIWLPRASDEPTHADGANDRDAEDPAVSVAPLRILLVDDHDEVRTTTEELLAELGHHVESAADGPAMLEAFRADPHAFDLIITDYAMPLVSGGDAIHEARALRPDIPAIIISGYADADTISRKPCDVAVLTKPFTPAQLLTAIAAAMKRAGD
jgi:CheY-like chemotaxis protein